MYFLLRKDTFLVADCSDDAVDIMSRKLLQNNKLLNVSAIYVVARWLIEFYNCLGRKVGFQTLRKLKISKNTEFDSTTFLHQG